ncbi:MAG: hypothetical protein H7256_11290 [Bdellovibrio sp.]|nr:hypothetical protein [Bdellovibrio sp.]
MTIQLSLLQKLLKVIIGVTLFTAGVTHLTVARSEFLAQVPAWVPLNPDLTVLLSGFVEIALGLLLMFKIKKAYKIGILTALFFVAVFPGNISQYMNGIDAFGLDTDRSRLIRLFFQPVLCIWALYSTGAITYLTHRKTKE